ncbi:MAG TPA: MFS transporter [Bryobacteraceae bacterium]|nr:MFS transporter [Bryobacteraceae bacterium]
MTRTWRLVALLTFTATASYLARVNVSVAGVAMMREFGLSQEAMGRVFSAFLLGYALCQIPGGMLADRFGAVRVLAIAAFGWAACTASMAAAGGGIALLLIARFALGVTEAPTFPSAARAISHWVPEHQRAWANGLVIAAIGIGSAIAPPLITFVMTRHGWRTALLVSAVPAAVAGVSWMLVRETPQPPDRAAEPGATSLLPRSRGFALLTLSYTLQSYLGYIFVYWFYIYLVDVRHFDLLRGALFGSLPWLLSIVSIPLGGLLFDKLGTRRKVIPIAGLAGSGVLTALGALTAHPYVAATCLAMATALVLSVEGPFWATMTRIAGGRSGAAGGAMNMGGNLGGFISPALTPVLASWMGWEAALLISAAIALAAGALWLGIPTRGGEEPSQGVC